MHLPDLARRDVDVTAGVDGLSGPPARSIWVTAGEETVDQDESTRSVASPCAALGAPVSATVSAFRCGGGSTLGGRGLREVTVPGLDAQQEAVVPGSGLVTKTEVHFGPIPVGGVYAAGATLRCDTELAT